MFTVKRMKANRIYKSIAMIVIIRIGTGNNFKPALVKFPAWVWTADGWAWPAGVAIDICCDCWFCGNGVDAAACVTWKISSVNYKQTAALSMKLHYGIYFLKPQYRVGHHFTWICICNLRIPNPTKMWLPLYTPAAVAAVIAVVEVAAVAVVVVVAVLASLEPVVVLVDLGPQQHKW